MIALRMTNSVGNKGSNGAADVYLIQALLNAFARKAGKTAIACDGKSSPELVDRIALFQKEVMLVAKPDSLVSANAGTFKALVAYLRSCFTIAAITAPDVGVLTWDSEGQEGGPYHSRAFHVPSDTSGVTLGRGYDMKQKTATTIIADLTTAGLTAVEAAKIGKAAGLMGAAARKFVIENDLLDFEITAAVQLALFKKTYDFHLADMKRISNSSSTVAAYGQIDWSKLPQTIVDILVDLRYRGDFTPASRKLFQKLLVDGEYLKFKAVIQDQTNWSGVPQGRFDLRSKYAAKITQPATTTPPVTGKADAAAK